MGSYPGGNGVSYDVGSSSSLTTVDIALDFTNAGGWTWAGDLLFAIVDLDGNGVEYGGYNMSYGYSSVGDYDSSFDTSTSGSFSTSIDMSAYGLNGVAAVMFADGYSGGASTDNWTGTMNIGMGAIPAPGAIALLGLAGIASRRRRK